METKKDAAFKTTAKKHRQTYQPGLELRLISMQNEPHMPRGLSGIISHVDDTGLIHARWIDGSSALLDPDKDSFIILTPLKGIDYLRQHYLVEADTLLKFKNYTGSNGYDCLMPAAQFGSKMDGWINEVLDSFIESFELRFKSEPLDTANMYQKFMEHIADVHEISRDNPYIIISKLARFKDHLRPGALIKVLKHPNPDVTGKILQVSKAQSNGVFLRIWNEPEHRLSKASGGRGMWMEFAKSGDYIFNDTILKYGVDDDGSREVLFEFTALPAWYAEHGGGTLNPAK